MEGWARGGWDGADPPGDQRDQGSGLRDVDRAVETGRHPPMTNSDHRGDAGDQVRPVSPHAFRRGVGIIGGDEGGRHQPSGQGTCPTDRSGGGR